MTSWVDNGPTFESGNSDSLPASWQQQMLIFAHELHALYVEDRETQASLTETRRQLYELTEAYADLVQTVGDEVQGSIAKINEYFDLIEKLDPYEFAESAAHICATLRTFVAELQQCVKALSNYRDKANPQIEDANKPARVDSAQEISQPATHVKPASTPISHDKQLAMLQAQNLTFAREMRLVYEAERVQAAELQASNRRLMALNRASLSFGTCQSVSDLVTIGLDTAREICEMDTLMVVIMTRKLALNGPIMPADVELVQQVGNSAEVKPWLQGLARIMELGAQNIVLPSSANHKLHVPLLSDDGLVGAIIVSGTGQALNDASSFLLTLAGLMSVTLANVRLYADLNEKQATLNHFVTRLLHAQEEERRRVAIDLHDGLAQTIASAHHFLEAARYTNHALEDDLNFKTGTRILKEAAVEVRRVMADLRPSSLDELGLVPTLRGFVQQLATEEGWMAEFETFGDVTHLNDPQIENNLFRITQEALTNIKKHAAATRVLVRLQQNGKHVHLAVRDWGQGMDMNTYKNQAQSARDTSLSEHMGLVGIAERARLLGGDFSIDSQPGTGTLIEVSLPLTQPKP